MFSGILSVFYVINSNSASALPFILYGSINWVPAVYWVWTNPLGACSKVSVLVPGVDKYIARLTIKKVKLYDLLRVASLRFCYWWELKSGKCIHQKFTTVFHRRFVLSQNFFLDKLKGHRLYIQIFSTVTQQVLMFSYNYIV